MKIIITIILSVAMFFSFSQENKEWLTDYRKAIDLSKEKSIPILISFSGSDWCQPCMLLSKTIFQTEEFKLFAKDSLVLLNIDFPRKNKNKPPKEVIKERERLAEKYNPQGRFPAVILINNTEEVLATTGYKRVSPKEYIDHIKKLINGFKFINKKKEKIYKETKTLMGSKFEVAAIHVNKEQALSTINKAYKEISRIEKLISSWNKNSQTSEINKNAGIKPVVVDKELFNLIKRAKKISVLTEGAFDISYAAIDNVWDFNQTKTKIPSKKEILNSVSKINFNNIILNDKERSVFLKEKGMKIGFGAIGKGYAANKAKHIMIEEGINNGMVNAGGDLIAWGEGLNNQKWKVGIADPNKQTEFISWLEIKNQAIVTSGDYEKYIMIEDKRYSHIIDPRTGYPARGIKSVTILCPDAEIADALATSVFIIGVEKGIELINKMNNFECIIVDENNDFITSKGIEINIQE